jgi:hypothetical protein
LVSVTAKLIGETIDLDRIWQQQDLSYQFKEQLRIWAPEVNALLHSSANGRMISEWAKKPECWNVISQGHYSPPRSDIPELV